MTTKISTLAGKPAPPSSLILKEAQVTVDAVIRQP